MAEGAVVVRGLRELSRDFRKMSGELPKELYDSLKQAAEPVRSGAEMKAMGKIRNMPASPRWAEMRTGVSKAQGRVYIVPQARKRGGSGRANLATLLLERAMEPALEENTDKVIESVDKMLGRFGGDYGF